MGNIKKFESGAVQVKKELPSEEIIRLDYLDGWEDVSEPQKAYLCTYFDTYPKRIKACIQSGITQSEYTNWINNDKYFGKLIKLIEQIHREELEHLEYVESYVDSKVRGRFLKRKEKKTPTTQQTVIFNSSGKKSSSFDKLDEAVHDIIEED